MKTRFIRLGITAAVSLLLALGVYALQASFRDPQTELNAILCDVSFSVGVIFLCIGLLILVSNLGAFHMLAYGMARFFSMFSKKPKDKRFVDYLEYKEAKKNASLPCGALLLVGAVYIAIAFFFLRLC